MSDWGMRRTYTRLAKIAVCEAYFKAIKTCPEITKHEFSKGKGINATSFRKWVKNYEKIVSGGKQGKSAC